MFSKHFMVAILSATLITGTTGRLMADNGLVGGLVGGIIGGALMNEAAKNNRSKQRVYRTTRPAVSSSQREQNREVQSALNHFSWNVGSTDGVLGSRSRAGISQYQAFMQFPVTGKLTELERTILVTSFQRAQLGGGAVTRTVSTHPQGLRGLLLETRDQIANGSTAGYREDTIGGLPPRVSAAVFEIARNANVEPQQLLSRAGFIQLADMNNDGRTDYLLDTSVTGSGFWCNDRSCVVRVFASTPDGYVRNDFQAVDATPAMFTCQQGDCRISEQQPNQPQMAGAAPDASTQDTLPDRSEASTPNAPAFSSQLASAEDEGKPAFPSFATATEPTRPASLASFCAKVGLVTSSNGGFIKADTLVDAEQALGEQFCLARSYAMEQGETMIAAIKGFSESEIAAQCRDFGALVKPYTRDIADFPRAETLRRTASFTEETGMGADQLGATAKICLSVGYRTDDMDIAVGSALVLAAVGLDAYGEMIGHHLATGIGVAHRPEMTMDWYEAASRATPVFAPGQPERASLIQKAAMMMNSHGATTRSVSPEPASTQGQGLPGFASKAAEVFSQARQTQD
ncbi:peptidoglycan-binding domain-containing protein [Aquicoccus sp.]|uniref:peptidoglycan-binding domain-containing protein n=1 Tax=Aquicoccus sp. TaxID=2055851 RepID=UPI003564781F